VNDINKGTVLVDDPMSKHLEKVGRDTDWEYFGLKKKDVSTKISEDLTYWIKHDAIPVDMIGKLKVTIDMIKAMINTDFKKTTVILSTEKDNDEKPSIST
tara:strand:+ start:3194 stop:3493 length:300 start_codon:yes stop_codon:yes gene_type:complete